MILFTDCKPRLFSSICSSNSYSSNRSSFLRESQTNRLLRSFAVQILEKLEEFVTILFVRAESQSVSIRVWPINEERRHGYKTIEESNLSCFFVLEITKLKKTLQRSLQTSNLSATIWNRVCLPLLPQSSYCSYRSYRQLTSWNSCFSLMQDQRYSLSICVHVTLSFIQTTR